MSTLLARIQVHAGKESRFEEVMAYMYRETHGRESAVLRYEYWRGQTPGCYYCLLSFRDNLAFWRHQASPHHEGQMARFQDCIADLQLEVVDPVEDASPLPPAAAGGNLGGEAPDVRTQAQQFPVELASWWLQVRR
mgnify:FL=1|jgi:quinol monooxygenase YgiN